MNNIKPYVSDMNVLCGAERYTVSEGKGKGVELIRLYNGKLQLFLKADKCLDIFRADYKGENAAFITKNGLVSAHLANTNAWGFNSGFDGGFLFTCGPDNIGTPVGTSIQHGMFSVLPAENIAVTKGEENGKYFVCVSGDVYYTALFGSKLRLHREVKLYYGENEIHLCDQLSNEGYVDDQYMIMYHFNVGYPFADNKTCIDVPSVKVEGVSDLAQEHIDKWGALEQAAPGKEEEVYVHTLKAGAQKVSVKNEGHELTFLFDSENLPFMTQWKTEACGDYGLGIEPATTVLNQKQFTPIKAGETKVFEIKVRFASEE